MYLVQPTTNVDGRLLDNTVDDLRKRCQEVRGVDFRVKEDLRSEESFVAHINRVFLNNKAKDIQVSRSRSFIALEDITLPVTLYSSS